MKTLRKGFSLKTIKVFWFHKHPHTGKTLQQDWSRFTNSGISENTRVFIKYFITNFDFQEANKPSKTFLLTDQLWRHDVSTSD